MYAGAEGVEADDLDDDDEEPEGEEHDEDNLLAELDVCFVDDRNGRSDDCERLDPAVLECS